MRIRNLATLALLSAWLALPSIAWANQPTRIITVDEVATGTPESTTIENQSHATGYLVVLTENETATASLVVTVYNSTTLGDFLICTMTAITTNTTTIALVGSTVAAADGITDACDFPMSRKVKFTFTVSGGGADFDITAEMHWVSD